MDGIFLMKHKEYRVKNYFKDPLEQGRTDLLIFRGVIEHFSAPETRT